MDHPLCHVMKVDVSRCIAHCFSCEHCKSIDGNYYDARRASERVEVQPLQLVL